MAPKRRGNGNASKGKRRKKRKGKKGKRNDETEAKREGENISEYTEGSRRLEGYRERK